MAQENDQKTASTSQLVPAYKGDNQVKPLPFNPSSLKGLSEKLLVSHHQNNYGGAVRRLNQIQQQIGNLPKDAQPYQIGSLKREELIATNSMILHEFYFGNLGGDSKASGTIAQLITTRYGSSAACAQSRDSKAGVSPTKPIPFNQIGCFFEVRDRFSLAKTTTTQPSAACAISASSKG